MQMAQSTRSCRRSWVLLAIVFAVLSVAAPTVFVSAVDAQTRADIALGFQDAVVDTLAIKCERALQATGIKTLVIAGGVGANRDLRRKLAELAQRKHIRVCFPRPEFCTDNGAMIAFAGALRLRAGQHSDATITVQPRWDMAALSAV